MLTNLNLCYGNVFYKESKISVSAILNFGKCSTFDLDDIAGRVIPRDKGISRVGSPFLDLFLGYGVKVKVKSECGLPR